jgi:hypothetical protein
VSFLSNARRTWGREHVVSPRQARVIRKRTIAVLLTLAVTFSSPFAAAAQEYVPAQSRSKAAFLATFPSFVDWPDGTFSAANSPLVACVLGDFRFGTPKYLATHRRMGVESPFAGSKTTSKSADATFSSSVAPNFGATQKSSRWCKAQVRSPSAKQQISSPPGACSRSHSKTKLFSSK